MIVKSLRRLYLVVAAFAVVVAYVVIERVVVIPERQACLSKDNSAPSGVCVWVRVVDTPEFRQRGLSGKVWMGERVGMLFLFDAEEQYGFWMKEMNFDLDLVWIRDGTVVDITEGAVAPEDKDEALVVYQPKEAVDTVLEVNSGWVERNNIKTGDKIETRIRN